MYELTMVYANGVNKVEKADLSTLMHCLSYYMVEEPWAHIEIMNCQTGEIIAAWDYHSEYGVTTAD